MRHAIMGSGNLGCALMKQFSTGKYGVHIGFKRAEIAKIRESIGDAADIWIWNTEGFGSVAECAKDPQGAWECHVNRVAELINHFPLANIVCFSTNYVVRSDLYTSSMPKENCESYYTYTKVMMEHAIRLASKSNVFAVRVANLYSQYNAQHSFAGRILANKDRITALPQNELIPTDTDWLASKLVENFQSFHLGGKIHAIAPKGRVSTHKLGSTILDKHLETSLDNQRPMEARMYNTIEVQESWVDVWNLAVEYRNQLGLGKLTDDMVTW